MAERMDFMVRMMPLAAESYRGMREERRGGFETLENPSRGGRTSFYTYSSIT